MYTFIYETFYKILVKKFREQSIYIVKKDMLFNHSDNALVTEGSSYSIQNYFCSLYFHRC